MTLDNFVTWDFVGTFAGAVIVVTLLVQFFKELPLISRIPTKYFAFMVALIVIVASSFASGTFSVQDLFLTFINAVLVTFTSTGGYDFAVKRTKVTFSDEDGKGNGE